MKEVTIEGRQPVLEALKAGRKIKELYIAEGASGETLAEIQKRAGQRGVPVRFISRQELSKIAATGAEQGVVALGAPIPFVDVDDILNAAFEAGQDPFILVLDQLQDPQNFASIIRTAEAVGVHGIIIPKNRSVTVTPTVEKVSAGAVEYVAIAQENIATALDYLKTRGCWVVGTDVGAPRDCFQTSLTGPVVLVIGSEGRGVSAEVLALCRETLRIPMSPHCESLNAAAAAAGLLWEAYRAEEGN